MRGLFVFQRDLRLEDQNGLSQALNTCEELCLSLVIDPELNRLSFEMPLGFNALERMNAAVCLEQQLIEANRPVYCGIAATIPWVLALCDALAIETVWLNIVNEPLYLETYAKLGEALKAKAIQLTLCQDSLAVPFEALKKKNNEPYKVFTPFYKLWYNQLSRSYLTAFQMHWEQTALLQLRDNALGLESILAVGSNQYQALKLALEETAGLQGHNPKSLETQWSQFKAEKMNNYAHDRDFPAIKGTSELSAAINNGQISFRRLVLEAMDAPHGAEFLRQLAWRSFYQQILCAFPEVMHTAFIEKYRGLTWENDLELFKKWQDGETGFDLIDAAMIQLKTEGRMPNRLRMLTASFLVKQLDVDWRLGETYFFNMLRDGDLAPNNGGWQWCASTGTDAQPYFRRFNPYLQAEKFDAEGQYRQAWLSDDTVHAKRNSIQPCVDLKQSGLAIQLKYKNISIEKEG